MTEIEDKYVHSAVHSWNGYVYQGKITIYEVIDYLIEHYDEDLERHSVELEWLEDFSIKNGEDYISIHQVKCKKDNRFSAYKDAFWKLLSKIHEGYVDDGKLHVAREINDFPDDSDNLCENYQPNDFEHELSNENVEEIFDQVTLKKYDENPYCSLNNLDFALYNKLEKFYRTHFEEDEYRISEGFINNCLLQLYHLIEKKLRAIHQAIHEEKAEKSQEILFYDFLDIIEGSDHADAEENFKLFKLREEIDLAYQEYCSQEEINSKEECINLVDQYYFTIKSLEDVSFLDFCLSITPHREIRNGFPNVDYEDLRYAFFRILKAIKDKKATFEQSLLIYRDSSNIYLPIALKGYEEDSEYHGQKILERARNSVDLVTLLYTIDSFISYKNAFSSLQDIMTNTEVIDVPREHHDSHKEKFNAFQDISMINLEEAKEKLNDD